MSRRHSLRRFASTFLRKSSLIVLSLALCVIVFASLHVDISRRQSGVSSLLLVDDPSDVAALRENIARFNPDADHFPRPAGVPGGVPGEFEVGGGGEAGVEWGGRKGLIREVGGEGGGGERGGGEGFGGWGRGGEQGRGGRGNIYGGIPPAVKSQKEFLASLNGPGAPESLAGGRGTWVKNTHPPADPEALPDPIIKIAEPIPRKGKSLNEYRQMHMDLKGRPKDTLFPSRSTTRSERPLQAKDRQQLRIQQLNDVMARDKKTSNRTRLIRDRARQEFQQRIPERDSVKVPPHLQNPAFQFGVPAPYSDPGVSRRNRDTTSGCEEGFSETKKRMGIDVRMEETYVWQEAVGMPVPTFVYSAFYDQRGLDEPTIVVIAIIADYANLGYGGVSKVGLCQLWYPNEIQPRTVGAMVSVVNENHGKRFAPTLHRCRVDVEPEMPIAVSIVGEKCQPPTNVLKILYPPHTTTNNNDNYNSNSNSSNNNNNKNKNTSSTTSRNSLVTESSTSNRLQLLPPEVDFTVCVTPLNNFYNNVHQLIEMIEVNRMFGAERLVFYNYSTGSDVTAVLRRYESEGVVRVLPWHLPPPADRISNLTDDCRVHYYGQLAALNDCAYRNMFLSRFLVMTDLDEILVPRRETTWAKMIISKASQAGGGMAATNLPAELAPDDKDYASLYAVQSTFFRADWRNDSRNIGEDDAVHANRSDVYRRLKLTTLLTKLREEKIFPHQQRSKYIVNGRHVNIVGIHMVIEFLTFHCRPDYVNSQDALIHHYRPTMWEEDPSNLPKRIYDPHMLRYSDEIVRRSSVQLLRHKPELL